jgi:hypothetical protein
MDAPIANAIPYKVTGTVLGVPIRLAEGDACASAENPGGVACPVAPGTSISFSLDKEISADIPAVSQIVLNPQLMSVSMSSSDFFSQ